MNIAIQNTVYCNFLLYAPADSFEYKTYTVLSKV